ncbi:MAG TPA: hypothetical protein VK545_19245, partial [Streptomyces sp.]|nr:hypothetical protein [Streptomyces sp.]
MTASAAASAASAAGSAAAPDPAWLPREAFRALGSRRVLVHGDGLLADTVYDEVTAACAEFGGEAARVAEPDPDDPGRPYDLLLRTRPEHLDRLGEEGFFLERRDGRTTVTAAAPHGLLHGLFHVVRLGRTAFDRDRQRQAHRPALATRMLNHWDNVSVHPVMGQVERGYAGGSLFWRDGVARGDLDRVRAYGRLLAASARPRRTARRWPCGCWTTGTTWPCTRSWARWSGG